LTELIETRDALLAENTTLSARNRIESIAVGQLGLGPTGEDRMVWLRPGQVDELASVTLANSAPARTEEEEPNSETVAEPVSDPANP